MMIKNLGFFPVPGLRKAFPGFSVFIKTRKSKTIVATTKISSNNLNEVMLGAKTVEAIKRALDI